MDTIKGTTGELLQEQCPSSFGQALPNLLSSGSVGVIGWFDTARAPWRQQGEVLWERGRHFGPWTRVGGKGMEEGGTCAPCSRGGPGWGQKVDSLMQYPRCGHLDSDMNEPKMATIVSHCRLFSRPFSGLM